MTRSWSCCRFSSLSASARSVSAPALACMVSLPPPKHLSDFIRDLLAEAAKAGNIRDDVAPGELASYCLHALAAAVSLPSKAAVRRLVTVTLTGMRPRADA